MVDIRAKLFIVSGLLVCVTSLTCIITLCSCQALRTKYVLFVALSVGDLINGLSVALAGLFRDIYLYTGKYYVSGTGLDCLFGAPWPIPLIIAGQFPALINVSILLERLVALHAVVWYRKSPNFKFGLVIASILLTAIFTGLGIIATAAAKTTHTDRMCTMIGTTGVLFGTVHYSLIAITYLMCFIGLMFTYKQLNAKRTPRCDERHRQRMTITLSGIGVVLVSIPNVMITANEWKAIEVPALVTGIAYSLYAIHSGLSFFVYITFRADFRQRFLELIGIQDGCFPSKSKIAHAGSVPRSGVATTTIIVKGS
ncbi:hypothetical protein Q1695_007440 [Nippostrongylus brasiliensis]|nr:hypothetical protein Q1695_007440 [Nippostrongylus brasiliensis]